MLSLGVSCSCRESHFGCATEGAESEDGLVGAQTRGGAQGDP